MQLFGNETTIFDPQAGICLSSNHIYVLIKNTMSSLPPAKMSCTWVESYVVTFHREAKLILINVQLLVAGDNELMLIFLNHLEQLGNRNVLTK